MKNNYLLLNISLLLLFPLGINAQCWATINAGVNHNLGVKPDGTLWTWGINTTGQLGTGSVNNTNAPTRVGNETNWSFAVGSYSHSIGLKTDGTLWGWGANSSGQLGNSNTANILNPIQIGYSTWTSVSAGYTHNIGIKTDGTLWTWGGNNYGQLGNGTNTNSYTPQQVGFDANWIVAVSEGPCSFAIKSDGTLWAWGRNNYGQLGDGSLIDRIDPVQIGTANNWKSITSGGGHTFAIKTNGTLWAWGNNFWGQLGDGTKLNRLTPVQIGTATNWKLAKAGWDFGQALKTDNTRWAWGYHTSGQLGANNGGLTPSLADNMTWKTIVAGSYHGLGITTDGQLYAWGSNTQGQLGNGTNINAYLPILLPCFPWVNFKAKVFLQGAYISGGLMQTYQTSGKLMPTQEPYTALGFTLTNGAGSSVKDSAYVFSNHDNNSIVDWVVVELREKGTPSYVQYSRPFLLQRDGDVVDLDGISPVIGFPEATPDNYYITIRHRNHLGFRTNTPRNLSYITNTFNFTNNSIALYGITPLRLITAGVYGMNPGDATHDGSIDSIDSALWELQNGNFDNYNMNADFNLDGSLDSTDSAFWQLNNGKYQELD